MRAVMQIKLTQDKFDGTVAFTMDSPLLKTDELHQKFKSMIKGLHFEWSFLGGNGKWCGPAEAITHSGLLEDTEKMAILRAMIEEGQTHGLSFFDRDKNDVTRAQFAAHVATFDANSIPADLDALPKATFTDKAPADDKDGTPQKRTPAWESRGSSSKSARK